MQVVSEEIDGLGVQEVARQLGVHEQTLRRWIWRGKVKATRSQVGKSYKWLVSTDVGADVGTPEASQQSSREQAVAAAFGSAGEPADPTPSPSVAREVTSQRDRLSAIEEQIEREIGRLAAQAATLQSEIDRLNRMLSILRSDGVV